MAQPIGDHQKKQNNKDGTSIRGGGLGWFTAALFIVADIAGGGVVAIPDALLNSGLLFGFISILSICIAFGYTAHILGQNWVTMCQRWPSVYGGQEHCRKPYSEMAFRAMGERARWFTSGTLNALLFGLGVVYLLIAARILSELWASLSPRGGTIRPCLMLPLLAAAFWPITFLKSPKDFWWAIMAAMLTTGVAVLLILVGTGLDLPTCIPHAEYASIWSGSIFNSVGIFFFSFGGHGVFPTIQHDMRHSRSFTRASVVAFAIIFAMYMPVSLLGVLVYGDSLHDSIISSIQTGGIQAFANLFIALHCILTLTIIVNPLNQELEHVLGTPQHFCWQRVLVRTGVLLSVVFIALSVPSFGPILNLLGGTFDALISAVFPCLFHLYLQAASPTAVNNTDGQQHIKEVIPESATTTTMEEQPVWEHKIPTFCEVISRTPTSTLMLNLAVIGLAILCGLAATYSAVVELWASEFSRPCYLSSATAASNEGGNFSSTTMVQQAIHCCGWARNISRYPADTFTCPSTTH